MLYEDLPVNYIQINRLFLPVRLVSLHGIPPYSRYLWVLDYPAIPHTRHRPLGDTVQKNSGTIYLELHRWQFKKTQKSRHIRMERFLRRSPVRATRLWRVSTHHRDGSYRQQHQADGEKTQNYPYPTTSGSARGFHTDPTHDDYQMSESPMVPYRSSRIHFQLSNDRLE